MFFFSSAHLTSAQHPPLSICFRQLTPLHHTYAYAHTHKCVHTCTQPLHGHSTCSYSHASGHRTYYLFWTTSISFRWRKGTGSYRMGLWKKCTVNNSWPRVRRPESNPSSSLHACVVLSGLSFQPPILDEEIANTISSAKLFIRERIQVNSKGDRIVLTYMIRFWVFFFFIYIYRIKNVLSQDGWITVSYWVACRLLYAEGKMTTFSKYW